MYCKNSYKFLRVFSFAGKVHEPGRCDKNRLKDRRTDVDTASVVIKIQTFHYLYMRPLI